MSDERQRNRTWEALKQNNDALLKQQEEGKPDPITIEQNERLNKAMDDQAPPKKNPFVARWGTPEIGLRTADSAHSDDYGSALVEWDPDEVAVRSLTPEPFPLRLGRSIKKEKPKAEKVLIDVENFPLLGSTWSLERVNPGGDEYTSTTIKRTLAIEIYSMYIQTYATKKMLLSTSFDYEEYLKGKCQDIFNETMAETCVWGFGFDRPKGILGEPTTTDSQDTWGSIYRHQSTVSGGFGINDIVAVYYSMRDPYRADASWFMNHQTLSYLRLLKSGDNYIFLPANFAAAPGSERDTIFGAPVYLEPYMHEPSQGSTSVMFADLMRSTLYIDGPMIFEKDVATLKPLVLFYAEKWLGFQTIDHRGIKLLRCGG